jgi:hypothetical protein
MKQTMDSITFLQQFSIESIATIVPIWTNYHNHKPPPSTVGYPLQAWLPRIIMPNGHHIENCFRKVEKMSCEGFPTARKPVGWLSSQERGQRGSLCLSTQRFIASLLGFRSQVMVCSSAVEHQNNSLNSKLKLMSLPRSHLPKDTLKQGECYMHMSPQAFQGTGSVRAVLPGL